MNSDASPTPPFPKLPCATIVFRALIYSDWIDQTTKEIAPAAFVRRKPPLDEKGLSVSINCSAADYLRQRFKKPTFGVGTLHVGKVRDLHAGLDVVQDAADHAVITGIPRQQEDRVLSERLASQLAKQARWESPV